MLSINLKRSGSLGGDAAGLQVQKYKVVVDGDTMGEFDGAAAKQMAITQAAKAGFGNSGLSEIPHAVAVSADTDEVADESNAFKAGSRIKGYRAEFIFTQRL